LLRVSETSRNPLEPKPAQPDGELPAAGAEAGQKRQAGKTTWIIWVQTNMDEVFIRIRSQQHYLWRAVDQDGNVLDILVQNRRNATTAKRFFGKLLEGLGYVPRVIVTDKLKSYGAAKREILPSFEHPQS
jgi:transposase-like protein